MMLSLPLTLLPFVAWILDQVPLPTFITSVSDGFLHEACDASHEIPSISVVTWQTLLSCSRPEVTAKHACPTETEHRRFPSCTAGIVYRLYRVYANQTSVKTLTVTILDFRLW